MQSTTPTFRSGFVLAVAALFVAPLAGCGPDYRSLRRQGQKAMIDGAHGSARVFYLQAEELRPRRAENLHDLGACSVTLARQKFEQGNRAAALRELDEAIGYYNQAIDAHPGHTAAIEGKNIALKLKGQMDAALATAEWAAEFVGPSARQYIFLAENLEERDDIDGAFLRYRQAVAVEPRNFDAHKRFAEFLLRHGNEEAAVFHLQTAYRINPLDEWVADELARRGAVPALASDRADSVSADKTSSMSRP